MRYPGSGVRVSGLRFRGFAVLRVVSWHSWWSLSAYPCLAEEWGWILYREEGMVFRDKWEISNHFVPCVARNSKSDSLL